MQVPQPRSSQTVNRANRGGSLPQLLQWARRQQPSACSSDFQEVRELHIHRPGLLPTLDSLQASIDSLPQASNGLYLHTMQQAMPEASGKGESSSSKSRQRSSHENGAVMQQPARARLSAASTASSASARDEEVGVTCLTGLSSTQEPCS